MIHDFTDAFHTALSMVFHFIPHFIVFLLVLLIGWFISLGVEKAVIVLLRRVGFDRLSDRIELTALKQRLGIKKDTTWLVGQIVFWFVFLVFLVPATNALGLPTVSNTLDKVVNYLPNVFVAALVLVLGYLAARFAGDVVQRSVQASSLEHPSLLVKSVRWSIIGFACLIALQQLEIAPVLITVLFAAIVGGIALAFGLSFGLGGRDSVQRLLARNENALSGHLSYNPAQIVQQAQADLARSEQLDQPGQDADLETELPPLSELQVVSPLSQRTPLVTPRPEEDA